MAKFCIAGFVIIVAVIVIGFIPFNDEILRAYMPLWILGAGSALGIGISFIYIGTVAPAADKQ